MRSSNLLPVGCEARKTPADAGVFFLDFYFYRTYQDLELPRRLWRPEHPTSVGLLLRLWSAA
jgi:hypothetical protein